jgi:hypothetical protein
VSTLLRYFVADDTSNPQRGILMFHAFAVGGTVVDWSRLLAPNILAGLGVTVPQAKDCYIPLGTVAGFVLPIHTETTGALIDHADVKNSDVVKFPWKDAHWDPLQQDYRPPHKVQEFDRTIPYFQKDPLFGTDVYADGRVSEPLVSPMIGGLNPDLSAKDQSEVWTKQKQSPDHYVQFAEKRVLPAYRHFLVRYKCRMVTVGIICNFLT